MPNAIEIDDLVVEYHAGRDTIRALQGALKAYQQVLTIFPDRVGLKQRSLALKQSGYGIPRPAELWKTMIASRRHVCDKIDESENRSRHSKHEVSGTGLEAH